MAVGSLSACSTVHSVLNRETPRATVTATVDRAASDVTETSSLINVTVTNLDNLVNHPSTDMKHQYDMFTDNLKKLQDSAARLRDATNDMQSQGQDYFVEWDKENAAMRNEDIRTRSAERKNQVAQRFDQVRDRYVAARDRLAPFVEKLGEIKSSLALDLTPAGAKSVQPVVGDVRDEAAPVRQSLDELAEEIRQLGVHLAPEATTTTGTTSGTRSP